MTVNTPSKEHPGTPYSLDPISGDFFCEMKIYPMDHQACLAALSVPHPIDYKPSWVWQPIICSQFYRVQPAVTLGAMDKQ